MRISLRLAMISALSAMVVFVGCGGTSDDDNSIQVPRATLKPLPTLNPDAPYFEKLESLQAASLDMFSELVERWITEADLDTPLPDFEPFAKEFLPGLATLMEETADTLEMLDPPASAKIRHDEYVDWHRAFAMELRETAVEVEQDPPPPSELSPGDPMTVGESFGFLAVAFYDFLGPTCARLERLAASEGFVVDLQCP